MRFLTALLLAVAIGVGIVGCGSSNTTTNAPTTTTTPASKVARRREKEHEIEQKSCEYDETHPAARRFNEEFETQVAVVIPLLRRWEVHPSEVLAKRITTIMPQLAHYNPITGASSVNSHEAKEFLSHENEMLHGC